MLICGPASIGDAAQDHCDYRVGSVVDADAHGTFVTPFAVRQFVTIGDREVNCLVEECSVVTTGDGGARILSRLPIAWTPEVEMPAAPALAAMLIGKRALPWSPARVTGRGFTPHAWVDILQCPSAGDRAVVGDDCVARGRDDRLRADAAGRVEGRVSVAPIFDRSNGERVDCTEQPICMVAVLPDPRHPDQRMALGPIDFGPGG